MKTFEKVFIHDAEFPLTNSEDDLQRYIKSNPKFDPTYIAAHCGKSRQETRNWIESIWKRYSPYAEPRFLDRLRSSAKGNGFHNFSWQMYLASVFLDKGYELEQSSGFGPDISLLINGKRYWIEAVTTTPGYDEKSRGMPSSGDIYQSLDPRVARISNALTKKLGVYKNRYLNKYCKPDEPFVIAINGTNTETMFDGRALEATVYARGNDVLRRAETGSFESGFYELRDSVEILKKGRKVIIGTRYFCDTAYKEISGVIYCEKHIINANNFGRKPEGNLHLAINSYAINPLEFFSVGNITSRGEDGKIFRRPWKDRDPQASN